MSVGRDDDVRRAFASFGILAKRYKTLSSQEKQVAAHREQQASGVAGSQAPAPRAIADLFPLLSAALPEAVSMTTDIASRPAATLVAMPQQTTAPVAPLVPVEAMAPPMALAASMPLPAQPPAPATLARQEAPPAVSEPAQPAVPLRAWQAASQGFAQVPTPGFAKAPTPEPIAPAFAAPVAPAGIAPQPVAPQIFPPQSFPAAAPVVPHLPLAQPMVPATPPGLAGVAAPSSAPGLFAKVTEAHPGAVAPQPAPSLTSPAPAAPPAATQPAGTTPKQIRDVFRIFDDNTNRNAGEAAPSGWFHTLFRNT